MEGLSQDSSCCLTEEDPARVDADDLICAWTLLNAVAVVIELTERCAEVVQIVTEDVGAQVVDDAADDLWEANHSFGKFQLLLVVQYNGGGVSGHLDLVRSQLCSASYGSGASSKLDQITRQHGTGIKRLEETE